MRTYGARSDINYEVNQLRTRHADRTSEVELRWEFPTLVDCYEFLVGKLVNECGLSTPYAEAAALDLPLTIQGMTLVVVRRRERSYWRGTD